jgi:hypothetical protein
MRRNKDTFLSKSECLNSYLHNYLIVKIWPDCLEEICEICGDRQFFKGDNLEYVDYHAKQMIFPQHPLYYHETNYVRDLQKQYKR